jgi:hypothetical protein
VVLPDVKQNDFDIFFDKNYEKSDRLALKNIVFVQKVKNTRFLNIYKRR